MDIVYWFSGSCHALLVISCMLYQWSVYWLWFHSSVEAYVFMLCSDLFPLWYRSYVLTISLSALTFSYCLILLPLFAFIIYHFCILFYLIALNVIHQSVQGAFVSLKWVEGYLNHILFALHFTYTSAHKLLLEAASGSVARVKISTQLESRSCLLPDLLLTSSASRMFYREADSSHWLNDWEIDMKCNVISQVFSYRDLA